MVTRRELSKYFAAGGAALLTPESFLGAGGSEEAPAQKGPYDCDLVIKGGTVIDPGQHLHAPRDVAVKDGKIFEVSQDFAEKRARQVVSAKGKIVTPGFVDLHAHCYDGVTFGMNADHYCLARGVTTVVDAGSTGYLWIHRFVKDIVQTSTTRVYALVHLCPVGATTLLDHLLDDPTWINPELTAKAAQVNKPATVGIKVHLSKSYSSNPKELEMGFLTSALKAAELAQVPLMVHINDTYYPLRDSLNLLRKGDIFTHCFNGFPTDCPLDANGKIRPEMWEARKRGVIFDVAEGFRLPHFTFDVAEKCLDQGFLPDTISGDLNKQLATAHVYDLPTSVSKFMALGMDIDSAIERVTVRPSQVFDFGVRIGTLRPGSAADIGIFELQEGRFEFVDGSGAKRVGRQKLVNHAAVCRGQLFVNEVQS